MNRVSTRASCGVAGVILALLAGAPALADDTELFIGTASALTGQPNVLFIIDTSGSMNTVVETQSPYDASVIYAGSCPADRVYWRSGTGEPPTCASDHSFSRTALVCAAALQAFAADAGAFSGVLAQYDAGAETRWEGISVGKADQPVECSDDSGVHGDGSVAGQVYAQNGDPGRLWSSDPLDEVAWGQAPIDNSYTVYDANYVNWYYGPTGPSTALEVVQDVATTLINTVSGVNVGLMRFNEDQGGPVIRAMQDVGTSRSGMVSAIDSLTASGFTPLSETLFEAGQYLRGANVVYGNLQGPPNSVDAARTEPGSDVYRSPIESTCQKNFIVLLTDGAPTHDVDAEPSIEGLPDFGSIVGGSCDGSGDGACLDDMADYLHNADLSTALPGTQSATTYTIGFTVDLPILAATAARGGGDYFIANDTASLTTVLTNIVTSILDAQTTFSAPTVAVNSFNRTRNLNDLFVAVFSPSSRLHWPGNLKKYTIDPSDGTILDATGTPAIDPATGFFADAARSLWSVGADGADVTVGGAADQLPDPGARRLYTYLGSANLTNSSNQVDPANALIDAALLGLGAPGDPSVAEVLEFARGADVTDVDLDGDTTEPRRQIGDPLHGQPATVIYGGTPASPDIDDALVFMVTNDGYLHAIDPTDGSEAWAFIPPEFLEDLVLLYKNLPSPTKHYGIDGSPTLQVVQYNNDGIIDPAAGERVYLYFGLRRGGTTYYGLDVTYKNSPRLLWEINGADLPGVGQTWSQPVPTRILVGDGSGQNSERLVLVFGGGYDPTQDASVGSTDASGNSIYIVDSVSGNLLWHAGKTGADRNLAMMDYSIPADIKVVDLDSDGLADRMYAADMGGQVWRFDIINGQDPASLVNGGVIAQLGAAPADPPLEVDTRRFYYAPDVALVNDGSASFIHIGIGSGHRAHPNSTTTQDKFYALRDYLPFATRSQAAYDALAAAPITDADLVDVTNDVDAIVPPGSPGWKFELRLGGWVGEKVLAESRTFDDKIFFTTFSPNLDGMGPDCVPKLGTNRLYVVDILTGKPVTNLDGSIDEETLTESDRYTEFNGSLSSEVVFLFPSPVDASCVGAECAPQPVACVDLFCFSVDFENNPIRTFWSQESTY